LKEKILHLAIIRVVGGVQCDMDGLAAQFTNLVRVQ
jgi:hypothetical protein